MFHKRGKQQELSEKEAKRVNEKFNSFKNKQYSEDDMNKVFDNEEHILNKMNNKYLSSFQVSEQFYRRYKTLLFDAQGFFYKEIYKGACWNYCGNCGNAFVCAGTAGSHS